MDEPNNPDTTTTSQAQGAPAAQSAFMTKEDWTAERNGLFADIRKMVAGISKQTAPTQEQPTRPLTQEAKGTSSESAPLTRDELERTLKARDEFHSAASSFRLSDPARSRMLRDFERERPEQAAPWVQAYVADFGLGGSTETKTPAPARSAFPVSDGSAPAPVTTPSDQIEPWRLSEDDVRAAIRRDGYAVAGAKFRQQFRSALSGRRIRLK